MRKHRIIIGNEVEGAPMRLLSGDFYKTEKGRGEKGTNTLLPPAVISNNFIRSNTKMKSPNLQNNVMKKLDLKIK